MLRTEQVHKHYEGVVALDEVSIEVHAGEVLGLIGPNGSGKSTLLNVLSGFTRPDHGRVFFGDRRIDMIGPERVAEQGLRRTFQLAAQPQRMSVLEVMLTGALLPTGRRVRGSLLHPRRAVVEEQVAVSQARELLAELQLAGHENEPAGTLSGGQQKLLSIGAALMGRPGLALLDEPVAGVNARLRISLLSRLRKLAGQGTTLVVVEHDMDFIGELCDRVYVLDKGKVLAESRPDELASDPRVVSAYLGGQSARAVTRRRGA